MANEQPTKGTLGLTGLTSNAMALIAPGAFLWLTFQMQSLTEHQWPAAPCGSASSSHYCCAWPQLIAMRNCRNCIPARLVVPLMPSRPFSPRRMPSSLPVWPNSSPAGPAPLLLGLSRRHGRGDGTPGRFSAEQFWPDTFSAPTTARSSCGCSHHLRLRCGYIAYRGVTGTTAVNVVINVVQISALLVFSIMAIGYRSQHPQGSTGYHLSNGTAVTYQVAQEVVKDDKGSRCR